MSHIDSDRRTYLQDCSRIILCSGGCRPIKECSGPWWVAWMINVILFHGRACRPWKTKGWPEFRGFERPERRFSCPKVVDLRIRSTNVCYSFWGFEKPSWEWNASKTSTSHRHSSDFCSGKSLCATGRNFSPLGRVLENPSSPPIPHSQRSGHRDMNLENLQDERAW